MRRKERFNTEDTEVGAQRTRKREPKSTARNGCATGAGLGLGNRIEDGLVRGVGFVMIWTFLVSRGYSAADCL
jgi:hypothetical protein